jgi:hypothetical protein
MRFSGRLRFWLLIAIALASHLALDALNSYGVHPFYPVDNKWYFGDAVFILEPWLWLLLGIAAAWNGRSGTARLAVAIPMALLLAAAARIGAIPIEAVGLLAVAGGIFAWATVGLSPRARAACGLAICVVIIGSFIGLRGWRGVPAVDALHPVLARVCGQTSFSRRILRRSSAGLRSSSSFARRTQSLCCGGGRYRWLRFGFHRRRADRIGSRARKRPGSSTIDGSRCEIRTRSR